MVKKGFQTSNSKVNDEVLHKNRKAFVILSNQRKIPEKSSKYEIKIKTANAGFFGT